MRRNAFMPVAMLLILIGLVLAAMGGSYLFSAFDIIDRGARFHGDEHRANTFISLYGGSLLLGVVLAGIGGRMLVVSVRSRTKFR